MDSDGAGHPAGIWSRLGHIFGHAGEERLERAIEQASAGGEVEPEEKSMLLGVLRFNDLRVQDIMTPRADIDCVADDAPLREVAAEVVSTGHSRLPVFREGRDNIVGVVHAKDLLPCVADPEMLGRPVSELMREAFFVPETKTVRSLLQEFRSSRRHIAIALDEYGGTSGLVTIEDLLEEIVGEIEDEHDKPGQEEIRDLGGGVYELSARVHLKDLARLGPRISSGDVETIGGFLTMEAGRVPSKGETFEVGGWIFTVLDADAKRVASVRMARGDESA